MDIRKVRKMTEQLKTLNNLRLRIDPTIGYGDPELLIRRVPNVGDKTLGFIERSRGEQAKTLSEEDIRAGRFYNDATRAFDGDEADFFVSWTELRQEAIKWINERISKCPSCSEGMICQEHHFWNQRFNIAERDLR